MVTATPWTNWMYYEMKDNFSVDLEMELSHISMDSSFLSLRLPGWLSFIFVWRSDTGDIALKKHKQTGSR